MNGKVYNYKNLLIETTNNDSIIIIKINRFNHRNSVDTQTSIEIVDVMNKYDKDDSLKVAILTGEGGVFCAGADLKELSDMVKLKELQNNLETVRLRDQGLFAPMGPSRIILTKPILAAVHGYAVAGGLELAIWCDIIVSHPEAKFGVFCRRVNVPLIDGGTVRLGKIIGYSRAMDLILTGRAINGDEAFKIGLVSRLTDKDKVLEEAINYAKLLCNLPQESMRSDRLSFIENNYVNLESSMKKEFRFGVNIVTSGLSSKYASKFSIDKKGRKGLEIKPHF